VIGRISVPFLSCLDEPATAGIKLFKTRFSLMTLPAKTTLLTLFLCTQIYYFGQSQGSRESIKTKIGIVSFDKNITGFQFATILKERFVYSKNGKKDLGSSTPKTGFFIQAIKNMDAKSATIYLLQLYLQFGKDNPEKVSASLKDSTFNIQSHKSLCSFFSVFDKNGKKKSDMLIGVIPVNSKTILFLSNDYTKGEYKKKFFKTFQSIQLL
jgi:hypothetical protein